jgi:hypothetical protein
VRSSGFAPPGIAQPVEELVAGDSEQVAYRDRDAVRGEQRVDLLAQACAQMNQLRPVLHELAEVPGRRWRDPALGQAVHAQQVGQISGVTFIFSELEIDLEMVLSSVFP